MGSNSATEQQQQQQPPSSSHSKKDDNNDDEGNDCGNETAGSGRQHAIAHGSNKSHKDAAQNNVPDLMMDEEQGGNNSTHNGEQQHEQPNTDVVAAVVSSTDDNNNTATATVEENTEAASKKTACLQRLVAFYGTNEFLILIVLAIGLARAYPPLGARYFYPDITATYIAVMLIFLLAGMSLKTEELLSQAFHRLRFNVAIQSYNFFLLSAFVYGVSRGLWHANILSQNLADGMVFCGCLPMTVNTVVVLTDSANGNNAAAVFNSAASNLLGVFVSPILILGYIGVKGNIQFLDVFYKVAIPVLLPVFVGQILRNTSKPLMTFYTKHKPTFKKIQEYSLTFIVYTVFCKTFDNGSAQSSSIQDVFLMILFQCIILIVAMLVAWWWLGICYGDQPDLRVMGLFGCTHKTAAMGIPLINAIYGNDSAVGLYTLPLLVWHPVQLILGSAIAPYLAEYVVREQKRFGGEIPDTTTRDENDTGVVDAAGEVENGNEDSSAADVVGHS